MPYQATVFSVFIASPGDVIQERKIIRDIITRWNVLHAKDSNVVLQSLGWEHDVYPIMGDHPQTVINDQILKDADLLIGVFWTRIGTPTKDYQSGSVEEIQKHIASGKPAMLYFSDQPVKQSSVDRSQYEAVESFRNWAKEKGIIHVYDSLNEFAASLMDQLTLMMQREKYFHPNKANGPDLHENHDGPFVSINLTDLARSILKESSLDGAGNILRVRSMSGLTIRTNKKDFTGRSPRDQAELESAIEELESNDLVSATSYKREVFRVTSKGYNIADAI